MKYSLSPCVTMASHENTLVFEDADGALYELCVEPEVRDAMIRILLIGADVGEWGASELRVPLEEITTQLIANDLIRTGADSDEVTLMELSPVGPTIACSGELSLRRAFELGCARSPEGTAGPRIYFTESPFMVEELVRRFPPPGEYVVCEFSPGRVTVSPLFGAESGLAPIDWIQRRRAASWWPEQYAIRFKNTPARSSRDHSLNDSQIRSLRMAIDSRLHGRHESSSESIIDLRGEITVSSVLRVPIPRVPSRKESHGDVRSVPGTPTSIQQLASRLVSKTTGLVREIDRLVPEAWWPNGLHVTEAKISDIESVLGWPADRIAAGASWDNADSALAAALGESVERYAGNAIPDDGFESGSFNELQSRGLPALDPQTLALYSEDQYRTDGFPFVPFTRDLRAEWVWGNETRSGKPCLAPAQLSYVNWYYRKDASEPTNVTMFAGIAAGPSLRFAEVSAIEELIERDAVHLWWHVRLQATRLDLPVNHGIAERLRTFGTSWRHMLISIPSDTGVPVIGCLLLDLTNSLVSLGIASRLDAESAALKAVAEAVQLHEYARGLLDEEGVIWRAVRSRLITGRNLKPIRADRRYLDSYRGDFHDVVDLPCQMQVYLDPRALEYVEPLWNLAERVTLNELTIPASSLEEKRAILLDRVEKHAASIVTVDLTTDDIRELGMSVVRVLAPGLYGNSPTAFPYFGGDRLAAAAADRYEPGVDWKSALRLEPPPYA